MFRGAISCVLSMQGAKASDQSHLYCHESALCQLEVVSLKNERQLYQQINILPMQADLRALAACLGLVQICLQFRQLLHNPCLRDNAL